MISRKLAGVSAASVGAATAAAALLLGTVPGSATDHPTASAYGIAASGLVPISPTPQVTAPPDGENALLELPSPLGVGVLKVSAAGHTSSATAVDLNIADLIEARVIEATCDNGVGGTTILNGHVADIELPSDPGVGEGVDASPVATIVANRQTQNDDGTLTVDGLVVTVLPGGNLTAPVTQGDLDQLRNVVPNMEVPTTLDSAGITDVEDLLQALQELNPNLDIPLDGGALLQVIISSATCGAEKDEPVEEAPKPEPVETKLPVTH